MCQSGNSRHYALLQWNGLRSGWPGGDFAGREPKRPTCSCCPACLRWPSPHSHLPPLRTQLHCGCIGSPPCLLGWGRPCHPTVMSGSNLGVWGEVSFPRHELPEGRSCVLLLDHEAFYFAAVPSNTERSHVASAHFPSMGASPKNFKCGR